MSSAKLRTIGRTAILIACKILRFTIAIGSFREMIPSNRLPCPMVPAAYVKGADTVVVTAFPRSTKLSRNSPAKRP